MIASDVPLPDPLPLPEPDVPDPTIASAVGAGVVLETTLLEVLENYGCVTIVVDLLYRAMNPRSSEVQILTAK